MTTAGPMAKRRAAVVLLMRPWRRSPYVETGMVALSMLLLSGISWTRATIVGTLKVDDIDLTPPGWALLGAALAVAWVPGAWAVVRLCVNGVGDISHARIVAMAVLIHGIALTALPLTSNDCFNYLAVGRLWLRGHNPYLSTPADLGSHDPIGVMVGAMWYRDLTAYGPLLTLLNILVASPGSVVAGLIALKLVLLCAMIAAMAIAGRVARGADQASMTRFALIAWNPLLAWEVVGQLHTDGIVVLCAVGFVALALGGRRLAAIVPLVIGFCAKPVLAPAIGLYLIWLAKRQPRVALLGAGAFALGLVLFFLPFWEGPETLRGPLKGLNPGPDRVTGSIPMLIEAAASSFSSEAGRRAYWVWTWAARASIAIVAVLLAVRVRSLEAVFQGAMFLTLLTLALATGWVLPWYGTWLLPWILTERSARFRLAVIAYTAALPVLYTPDAIERATVVVTLAVHLVPLWLAWRWWREESQGVRSGADSHQSVVDS